MATSTPRVGFVRPEIADTTIWHDLYTPMLDKLDSAVGAQVYTASTRPASGYSGKIIWETTYNAELVHNGSAWRYSSVPAASTMSSVTGTHTGQMGIQTSDLTVKLWNGASWVNPTSTASTTPASTYFTHYEFTTTASTTSGSDYWPLFNSAVSTGTYAVHSNVGGESVFTLSTTGLYEVQAQAIWASNTTGRRALAVNGATSSIRFGGTAIPAAANGLACLNIGFTRYFSAGQVLQVVTNQDSGGALNHAVAASGLRTWISIRYIP